jgi:hypothetical protein
MTETVIVHLTQRMACQRSTNSSNILTFPVIHLYFVQTAIFYSLIRATYQNLSLICNSHNATKLYMWNSCVNQIIQLWNASKPFGFGVDLKAEWMVKCVRISLHTVRSGVHVQRYTSVAHSGAMAKVMLLGIHPPLEKEQMRNFNLFGHCCDRIMALWLGPKWKRLIQYSFDMPDHSL